MSVNILNQTFNEIETTGLCKYNGKLGGSGFREPGFRISRRRSSINQVQSLDREAPLLFSKPRACMPGVKCPRNKGQRVHAVQSPFKIRLFFLKISPTDFENGNNVVKGALVNPWGQSGRTKFLAPPRPDERTPFNSVLHRLLQGKPSVPIGIRVDLCSPKFQTANSTRSRPSLCLSSKC